MAESLSLLLAEVNYYARQKYYGHLQAVCKQGLKIHSNDPILSFWKSFATVMQDQLPEGIRGFEKIIDRREVSLACIMALIFSHKRSETIDKEAIKSLKQRYKTEERSAGEEAVYQVALFLWHIGEHEKSRDFLDRLFKMAKTPEGLALRGWVDLTCDRDSLAEKSVKFFDEALSMDRNVNIDALLGKSKYLQLYRQQYDAAIELLNKLIVQFSEFVPSLAEKISLCLAKDDWDQSQETAHRLLLTNPHSIDGNRAIILHNMCREGNLAHASQRLGELVQALERYEPNNPGLMLTIAQSFARIADRNSSVLEHTMRLCQNAHQLAPLDSSSQTEIGYQYLLQGDTDSAMNAYREALSLDETSVPALHGIIHCQLLLGLLEDAEQQLEFLNEIQVSIGKSTELLYLSSILALQKQTGAFDALNLLSEAVELHMQSVDRISLHGEAYIIKLNPDFLLSIVREYLHFCPSSPKGESEATPLMLLRASDILETLSTAVPGLLSGVFFLAKVQFLEGKTEAAQSSLQRCLQLDSTYSDAHLLMAQVYLSQDKVKLASQSLEIGLSYTFEVRDSPLYRLIRSRIQTRTGNHQEALKTLQGAMQLPGVKTRSESAKKRNRGRKQNVLSDRTKNISNADRASVYLELAAAHRQVDQIHEATKIMQDALNEFSGTEEEVRINISNAHLAVFRGDVDEALIILRSIQPGAPYYTKAKSTMADIYLNHLKDKRMFASCYQELLKENPSVNTCLMLGDAYMSIQEPDKAIPIYEMAMKKEPHNALLACKTGRALVKTHDYKRATNYYESALKNQEGISALQFDLAELYIRLQFVEKAQRTLAQVYKANQGRQDWQALLETVRTLTLLADVHEKGGNLRQAIEPLLSARDTQSMVLSKVNAEAPDQLGSQKLIASDISYRLGEIHVNFREFDQAITFYKDAIHHEETNIKAALQLAELHLQLGELDNCQQQCVAILHTDKSNDRATIMVADVMFRKNEYESATFHFQQLLEHKPDHFVALARLIDILRRAGKLSDGALFLEKATKASAKAAQDPGLNYCKGLYSRYSNLPNDALKHFNLARKDSEWGMLATEHMIEICLNPDNETMGGETLESMSDTSASTETSPADKMENEVMALRTSEKLLKELRKSGKSKKCVILECYALIATKTKANLEKALSKFMEIVSSERDHVPALLGMATAYMMLKQTPRARNQLKRIAKMEWNSLDAEDYERSWLLLADIYIQAGKYDLSQELLKKVLAQNKSSGKAWEYMGYIMEKEQSYRDAADHYDNAWQMDNFNSPGVGYKLAFNHLKAKRYVEAIEVCHRVLGKFPKYPKIREEILEKARKNLRV